MSVSSSAFADPFDARRAPDASGLMRIFNDALVLTTADVHVASRLGVIAHENDEVVLLAAALAARAPRLGHVCVDVASAAATTLSDADDPIDVGELPWPPIDEWLDRLASSPLVAVDDDGTAVAPLRLAGTLLYLDRYWRQERQIAADLVERSNTHAAIDLDVLAAGLDRLFRDDPPDLQRLAAAVAVLRTLTVIAGGPGTGKTSTVARIVTLLDEQASAASSPLPKVALAAPTGKAAARLEQSVHAEAASLETAPATRARLLELRASTIHRLLGWRPDSRSRFRHDRTNRLPYDTVVIDETSMVSVSLMAKLVEAVRPDARLILVGDPDQLSSVEAGAVLGDVVGPASLRLRMSTAARDAAAQATGQAVSATEPSHRSTVGNGIVVLRRVHRFGGGIADLAIAIQHGDPDATVHALRHHPDTVTWLDADDSLEPIQAAVVDAGREVSAASHAGNGLAALAALGAVRLLCAHRRGPYGVASWMDQAERWLAAAIPDYGAGGRWYFGRPLLVTQNDYSLRLFNGDVGVIIDDGGGSPTAAFDRQGDLVLLAPSRLEAVETVHAMTVHKSQGSQFDSVAVILPEPDSRILTRELLYTAVTRARRRVYLVGTEASVRAAVERPIARASGLRQRLWGG